MERENVILKRTISFSLKIIDYCEQLSSLNKYVISNQLLKSGTSIGANIHEAQNAESKQDFIHKIKIAAKEIDETEYWLMLCQESKHYPDVVELKTDLIEIKKIVTKIISTSKKSN